MRRQKFGFWTDQRIYRWSHRIVNAVFWGIGRLESHGNHNIPQRGGALLLSNHASHLDPIIIGGAANRELHYMTRHDTFDIPLLGKLAAVHNAFPIKRGVADRAALRHTISLLKSGKVVLIFPEGTRSPDGALQKAHQGVSFIAYHAGVPAIPTFLGGTQRLLPRGAKWIHPAKLTVTFGGPMDFSAVRQLTDKREAYTVMGEQIMQAIGSLRNQQKGSAGG